MNHQEALSLAISTSETALNQNHGGGIRAFWASALVWVMVVATGDVSGKSRPSSSVNALLHLFEIPQRHSSHSRLDGERETVYNCPR
jgi:hypothetical protein